MHLRSLINIHAYTFKVAKMARIAAEITVWFGY